jgi:SHS2 domain-containing protein
MKRFELIDHTADIGIIAYGDTLEELFENTAYGLFSIITDIDRVEPKDKYELSVKAMDGEELLISWLNELIYFWEVKRILASKFKVNILSSTHLESIIYGEKFSPQIHKIEHIVKAVTYYDFKLISHKKGWEAQVILDV